MCFRPSDYRPKNNPQEDAAIMETRRKEAEAAALQKKIDWEKAHPSQKVNEDFTIAKNYAARAKRYSGADMASAMTGASGAVAPGKKTLLG